MSNAKKVHAYVRDADDTIEWIEEKDLLVSSEDYGHDVVTVQALIVKHDGFEVTVNHEFIYCLVAKPLMSCIR